MKLAHHYLRLRSHFPMTEEGQQILISIDQLSEILCYSNRNTNLILKKLVETGWIEWSSGRGRGNMSRLTFVKNKYSLLLEVAKEMTQKGDTIQALELLKNENSPVDSINELLNWMYSQFGYKFIQKDEQQIDMLRFPMFKKRWVLDPVYSMFANEVHLNRQIFDSLVRFNPQTKQVEPQLSHYWESNFNQTEWTFYLRKGVMFHNRKLLTADDVVFSLTRVKDTSQPSSYRWVFDQIKEVIALGNHIIKIKLNHPDNVILHLLSSTAASIISKEIYELRGEEFSRLPIGTGPFRVTTHDNDRLVLEANVDYFQGRPHLDRVEIWLLPDIKPYISKSRDNMFQMRDHSNPPEDSKSTEWEEESQLQHGCVFLSLNLSKNGPQQDTKFRQAFFCGIDLEKLVSNEKNCIIANRLFPEFEEENVQHTYDAERARKLLKESEYQGEILYLSIFPTHEKVALAIQNQCKEIGIHLEIIIQPFEQCMRVEDLEEADIVLFDVVFEENMIYSYMEFFHMEPDYIIGHLSQEMLKDVNRQLAICIQEPDNCLQLDRLSQLEQQLIVEGIFFPLFRRNNKSYYHPALKGVSLRTFGWTDFNDIWFQSQIKQ